MGIEIKHIFRFALLFFIIGCSNSTKYSRKSDDKTRAVAIPGAGELYYKSLFGETYLTEGGFLNNSKDYIETNLWTYTNLNRPLVLSGSYFHGMPQGEWSFLLKGGILISSQWNVYDNRVTPCRFSLPFQCEEQYKDSFTLKLKSINDSLGKIGIMVQIRDTTLNQEELASFTIKPDIELKSQGYRFTNNKREIENGTNKYFFYEYFLKDSNDNKSKVYYFFGNMPSKKHFVLFTFFHQGPREDLAQIICNLVATGMYVDNERFYNPYHTKKGE
jgi:hypothetical protein